MKPFAMLLFAVALAALLMMFPGAMSKSPASTHIAPQNALTEQQMTACVGGSRGCTTKDYAGAIVYECGHPASAQNGHPCNPDVCIENHIYPAAGCTNVGAAASDRCQARMNASYSWVKQFVYDLATPGSCVSASTVTWSTAYRVCYGCSLNDNNCEDSHSPTIACVTSGCGPGTTWPGYPQERMGAVGRGCS